MKTQRTAAEHEQRHAAASKRQLLADLAAAFQALEGTVLVALDRLDP